jgi:O-succinylbenzoic acid--CoA ligase
MGVMDDDRVRDPRVEGWYPTGDVGRVDAQGRLHVKGRVDRQFISGGENIQPEELEVALERIEAIERAVVVAVPDEEYGRRPVAFVQSDGKFRPDAWRKTLATTLPRFKIPDAIYRLPTAAVEGSMKVDHDLLRQRARSG